MSTTVEPITLEASESITYGGGTLVFTDGSDIQGHVGAGYVIPQTGAALAMKVRGPQTANRAEMTAHLAALEDIPQAKRGHKHIHRQ